MFNRNQFDVLRWCLQASIAEVFEEVQPDRVVTINTHYPTESPDYPVWKQEGKLAFKDNGSSILAVCHLDTVSDVGEFAPGERGHLFASALDDRLGLFTMLDYMPQMTGVRFDWLFCDLEETGNTTGEFAHHIIDGDKYNWIVEFDRGGTDVVAYQYIDEELHNALSSVGYRVNMGSFTDIVAMERLRTKAFNVGVGYHDAHNLNGYMVYDEYETMMRRFVNFWDMYADVPMPHLRQQGWFNHHDFERGFRGWINTAIHDKKVHISETGNLRRLYNTRYLPWKAAEDLKRKNRKNNNFYEEEI